MKKIVNKFNNKELMVIVKYLFSSGTSFLIDLLLFSFFNYFLSKYTSISIIISTILSRIVSSFYNYFINSRYVFKKWSKTSIIKYYILVVIQTFTSALLVQTVYKHLNDTNVTILKVFVDIIIFIVNFIIQRKVIFR